MMTVSKLDSSKRLSYESLFSHTKIKICERGVSLEKLVAILDVMPEYGKRLATYLNGSRTFPYRALVFSDAAEIENYVRNDGLYAVVAAEELEKDVLEVTVGTKVKLFLIRESKDTYHASSLYRYDSAKEIEQALAEKRGPEKRVPIIGFFSPAGGSEAETLSRRVAEALGKNGKVLYIPMFPFGIYDRDGGDGLSEAFYYIRQAKGGQVSRLRELLRTGSGMDSIGPVRWYTDLNGVTKEDAEALFGEGIRGTEYKAYFVAVGQFDNVGRDILSCCDNVLVPVWETKDGKQIQEQFRRQIKESGETKLYAGMLEFTVKETGGLSMEEAVAEAVEKGGKAIAECGRRDSDTNVGTAGFVGRINR